MMHEERKSLTRATQDMKRALDSLEEELQATDWYRQRADACTDADLKRILIHNMKEEEEHASMLISWIAARDKTMAGNLTKFLKRRPADIGRD